MLAGKSPRKVVYLPNNVLLKNVQRNLMTYYYFEYFDYINLISFIISCSY